MTKENGLFPAFTRARSDDRWTSKAAAERIAPTLNEKQSRVLGFHIQHRQGLTNWELETLCGSHNSTWRTRVSELVQMGLIVATGRTRRIANSDDARSERTIFLYKGYALPDLFELPPPGKRRREKPTV